MATASQWYSAARPRTFPTAIAPVLAGTAIALFEGSPSWWRAVVALLLTLFLQIGVNYANDYSDGVRGTDDDRVGPMRLVGSGLASAQKVKAVAFAFLGLGAVAGLSLAIATSWWLVPIGAACILAAWFYTGGSKPYGYLGLGEVMVFVFFGLVAVVGTAFVQTNTIDISAIMAGIGIGALACAVLVANNLRDIETDRVAGKRTLAVILGDQRTRYLYVMLLGASLVALAAVAVATSWLALLGLVVVQQMYTTARLVLGGAVGEDLIDILKRTAVIELGYACGMFAGLLAATNTGLGS